MLLRSFKAPQYPSAAAHFSRMAVNYCSRNNGPQRGTHSIWSGRPEGPGPDVSGTKPPQLPWKPDNTPSVWQLMRETSAAASTTGLTHTRRPVRATLRRQRALFHSLNPAPRPSRAEDPRHTSKQTQLTSKRRWTVFAQTNARDKKPSVAVFLPLTAWIIAAQRRFSAAKRLSISSTLARSDEDEPSDLVSATQTVFPDASRHVTEQPSPYQLQFLQRPLI